MYKYAEYYQYSIKLIFIANFHITQFLHFTFT